MASTAKSSILKGMARTLAPAVRDTRKFRLKKPIVLTAEEAQKLAHAFNETRGLTAENGLTLQKMIVALAENALGATKLTSDQVKDAEETMAQIFVQQGPATHATVVE